MDSKQLYIASQRFYSQVDWDKEWVHFGTGKEVKTGLISDLINDFLLDENIYFIQQRQNSGIFTRTELIDRIQPLLGREEFQLWNKTLTKVITFNHIGVLRLGRKSE